MRLVEIPDDGIVSEYIWAGDSGAGIMRIDLSYLPTIEAEPVRHGRWEFKHPNGWSCSECGEWGLMIDNRGICKSNYCPNCGAKMDLVEERHEPDEH